MKSRSPEQLLFTDTDGNPTQLQDLMDEGLDGGYEDRIPELIELMEYGEPVHRLWACMLLTGWGHERGLEQVARWARDPDSTPWASRPVDFDRIYGAGSSFASLADAVRTSFRSTSAPSLKLLQIKAIEALLDASSSHFVDRDLDMARHRVVLAGEQLQHMFGQMAEGLGKVGTALPTMADNYEHADSASRARGR